MRPALPALLLALATATAPGLGAAPDAPPAPGLAFAVALRAPIAFGDLLPGESTPRIPFELSPVPPGEGVALATVLGAVSGLAVEAPVVVPGAMRPVALDTDRSGRLYLGSGGAGRVFRFTLASASPAAEAARPASPPTGIALRRRNGNLFVSTGGPLVEVHRPGRERPSTLDAGRSVTALRIDGKNAPWAAGGNAVLSFDEAKPGPARALGAEGSEVLSFDVDARGTVHAVLREGDARRVVVSGPAGPSPLRPGKGSGADAFDAPTACRFDGEGSLWVSASPREPEGTVLGRFQPDGTPLGALSRLALALLLDREDEAGVPAVVDLAPGPERRLNVLLEDGAVFAIRPF